MFVPERNRLTCISSLHSKGHQRNVRYVSSGTENWIPLRSPYTVYLETSSPRDSLRLLVLGERLGYMCKTDSLFIWKKNKLGDFKPLTNKDVGFHKTNYPLSSLISCFCENLSRTLHKRRTHIDKMLSKNL